MDFGRRNSAATANLAGRGAGGHADAHLTYQLRGEVSAYSNLAPSLFDLLDPKTRSIDERFRDFHRRHPEVYEGLRDLALRFAARGRGHWSIDAAYHVLRWERRMAGLPDPFETHKLNDHYTSRYARLLMAQEPELEGLFEVRGLRSVTSVMWQEHRPR